MADKVDKTDKKDEMVTLTKSALEDLITTTAVAVAAQLNKKKDGDTVSAEPTMSSEQCPACGQLNNACKGKHRQIRVLPTLSIEHFDGIKINGVVYWSKNGNPVTVPEDCNIEYMLTQWDDTERALKDGRKRVRYSGSVGNQGTGHLPLNANDFFR